MPADPRTEQWLRDHGANFHLATVPMSHVDVTASHRNQARISEPVDPNTVTLYTGALNNNATFPPTVGYYASPDHFVFIDGNHRHAAYQNTGKTLFESYVVEAPTDIQIRMLTYDANTRHGKPTTLTERIEQAAWLVATGTSGADAARALGIPPQPLYTMLQRINVDRRLERLGFDYTRIAKAHRQNLHRVSLDAVLLKAAHTILQTQMNSDESDDLIRATLEKTSESEQLDQIDRERAKREAFVAATAGGMRDIPRPFRLLNRLIASIENYDVSAMAETPFDNTAKTAYASRLLNARARINTIIERLS